ncbi:hypothetical protein FI667_g9770, partial [Globisporangium splendens]
MEATPSSSAAAAAARRSAELPGDMKLFISRFGSGESPAVAIPLELKILSVLVVLFLFLLFLIMVLWDRYGKEIGELYTPSAASDTNAEVNVNDVADEYTVYQKLPTFFYEYTQKKRR